MVLTHQVSVCVWGKASNRVGGGVMFFTLGGTEPDLSRLAQAAANLNVTLHKPVTVPSSGNDTLFSVEWHD